MTGYANIVTSVEAASLGASRLSVETLRRGDPDRQPRIRAFRASFGR